MKKPTYWDLAVLVAPLCKFAEKSMPHPVLISFREMLCRLFPKWKITPFVDVIDASFRNPEMRDETILMGESLGGAVALLLHMKKPNYWDMAVLVAPMCKFAEEFLPHPVLLSFAEMLLCRLFPTWKIAPFPDTIDVSFRAPETNDEIRANPLCYKGRVRLATALQILKTSFDLETRLEEVSLPFLVIHGGKDRVFDPSVSRLLYERAHSSDKTFKLYPDMWHSLTCGELPENIGIVFADIVKWLEERLA